jgi:hypothetical protein
MEDNWFLRGLILIAFGIIITLTFYYYFNSIN